MLGNKKGVGLVGVLIASGLLVLLALTVSRFIVQFNQQSIRIENSSACQSIAKDVIEYFKKDDNALFITSVGPDPATKKFPAGIVNEDGVERFNFGGGGNTFSGTSPIIVASDERPLPTTATFYSYLNYQNSFNRLLALAYSQGKCCTDAVTCNGLLYDSSNPTSNPPSLKLINNGNPFQVFLGVNPIENGTSICNGTTPDHLVDPRASSIQMEFYVRVVNNPTDSQKRSQCTASGQVQFPRDSNAPLTILSLDKSPFCGAGKALIPSMCVPSGSAPVAVRYKVRTVRNNAACNICLKNSLEPYRCGSSRDDAFQMCYSPTACVGSDPGSIFLCRIGEKKWFYNPANFNKWEPCEQAKVYDGAGSPMGATVTIDYNTPGSVSSYQGSSSSDPQKQQKYTEAAIEISGLSPQAVYVVDVRAVDGGGQKAGASFCSLSKNCSLSVPSSGAGHFVISNGPPTTNSITPSGNIIGPAGSGIQGSINPTPPYQNALNGFSGHFQCSVAYRPRFDVAYSYNNNPNSNILGIENGNYSLTPTGDSGPIFCSAPGLCSFQASGPRAGSPDGLYSVSASVGNECFPSGSPQSFSWCLDNTPNFSITAVSGDYNSSLQSPGTGITGKSFVNGKQCGISFARPKIGGTASYDFVVTSPLSSVQDSFSPGSMGWQKEVHSGCVARDGSNPGVQYCIRAFDPCGRAFDSNIVTYSSTLAVDSPVTNHTCGGSGSGFYGNSCDTGSNLFCSSGYKCLDRSLSYMTSFGSNLCDNSTDCQDMQDCPGTQGTCSTKYYCDAGSHTTQFPSCSSQGAVCTLNKGHCRGVCKNHAGVMCINDAGCPSGDECDLSAKACTLETSRSCADDDGCKPSGSCQYLGSQGTCSRPNNLSCGSTSNYNSNHACPDLNSCTISSPPSPSCPTPSCPPPPGGYPSGCPVPTCPVCAWVVTNPQACQPDDPCKCDYKPDFKTTAQFTPTYACKDTATGNACDASLCGAQPTGPLSCESTCENPGSCCPEPTCPPPVGGYPVGCPAATCTSCDWVLTNPEGCRAEDPCSCTYSPSFQTTAQYTPNYACLDTTSGATCAASDCTSPKPSGATQNCTETCPVASRPACPACTWEVIDPGTCSAANACDCQYSPSFKTNGTKTPTYGCRNSATGVSCAETECSGPKPSPTPQSCTNTCASPPTCPTCNWVQSVGTCNATNACDCQYSPSFTTTGQAPVTYSCKDQSGNACGSCMGAAPANTTQSCTNTCASPPTGCDYGGGCIACTGFGVDPMGRPCYRQCSPVGNNCFCSTVCSEVPVACE